jgi:hypothetical protein
VFANLWCWVRSENQTECTGWGLLRTSTRSIGQSRSIGRHPQSTLQQQRGKSPPTSNRNIGPCTCAVAAHTVLHGFNQLED